MNDEFPKGGEVGSNENSAPVAEVPEHILDMIPTLADTYIVESGERLLAGIPAHQHELVLAASTHNVTRSSERRALHAKILQALAADVIAKKFEKPAAEKPIKVYITGPMAVGKTTLLSHFDQRIAEEKEGQSVDGFEGALEAAYQYYKQAGENLMRPDFNIPKAMLPEFEVSGKNYTFIRAEASALVQAVEAWSKELGANIVLEELGNANLEELVQRQAKDYTFVLIGVTADPAVNAQGLRDRCEATGQNVSERELAETITGFSQPGSFLGMSKHADCAVLLSSDHQYKVVYECAKEQEQISDRQIYDRFVSYGFKNANDLVSSFGMEKGTAGPPSPGH